MERVKELFEHLVTMSGWLLENLISGRFWTGIAVGGLLLAAVWSFVVRRRYRVTQVTLNMPFGLGNVTYEAAEQDRVLAWKMYIQLKTRKAALPFDENYDVVADVFDSLRAIFPATRSLLSDANPYRGEAQATVADFVLRVLNDGIRPHLTRWHATFRNWWDEAVRAAQNQGRRPQDLQRDFPQYGDMVADIKKMNDGLAMCAEELLAIVRATPKEAGLAKKVPQTVPQRPDQQTVPVALDRTADANDTSAQPQATSSKREAHT